MIVAGRASTRECFVVGVGDGRVAGTRMRIARDDVVAPAGQDLIVAGRALVLAQVVGVGLGIAFGAASSTEAARAAMSSWRVRSATVTSAIDRKSTRLNSSH